MMKLVGAGNNEKISVCSRPHYLTCVGNVTPNDISFLQSYDSTHRYFFQRVNFSIWNFLSSLINYDAQKDIHLVCYIHRIQDQLVGKLPMFTSGILQTLKSCQYNTLSSKYFLRFNFKSCQYNTLFMHNLPI